MDVLKATFCAPCKVGEFGQIVHALLSGQTFMRYNSFFKMTMLHNSEATLCEEDEFNPFIRTSGCP
jgi:hypothetical protein